jgi:tRNA U34 5-carboxymethylaminomethyl modifying GTPase MnmE/TrmE
MQHSTIAAIATAPGAGGIAIVRLSGPESYEVAAKVFRPANPAKKVADAKGYTAMFGAFVEGEEAFDEGVALFFRAPHSYTGEDVVELSCHGGSAVARRLVEACIAAGASPAAPGEYTRRAFLNGKLSLTQAEAVMDIISADGRQGAALEKIPAQESAPGHGSSRAARQTPPESRSPGRRFHRCRKTRWESPPNSAPPESPGPPACHSTVHVSSHGTFL